MAAHSDVFLYDPTTERLADYAEREARRHSPASPGFPPATDVYTIRNVAGGNRLDVNGNLLVCSTSALLKCSQYWRVLPAQTNYWVIQNVATDLCVKVVGSGKQCALATLNADDDAQNWSVSQGSDGNWMIRSKQNAGLVLDLAHGHPGNNVAVYSFQDDSGSNQRWLLARQAANETDIPSWAAGMLAHSRLKCPNSASVYPADETYSYITAAEVSAIWSASYLNPQNPNHVSWIAEVFDCDDFAVTMKALVSKWCYDNRSTTGQACGLGIAWTSDTQSNAGHAINIYFDQMWMVRLLEPQNGMPYTPTASEQAFMITL